MKFSVLINTYNRGYLLKLALLSYLRQSEGDFEIIVADDGSTDDTPIIVGAFKKEAPFKVKYVYQEHKCHRRAAILNRGIEQCDGKYILFTDCDSLAMHNLIEIHRRNAKPDKMLCGGYVRLSQKVTESLSEKDIHTGAFEKLFTKKLRKSALRKHIKAQWQILIRRRRRPHNMGLNYSVSTKQLYKINGYDEYFTGWGSADGDVRERLRMIGVTPVSLYNTAIVLHMWHPTEKTKFDKENLKRNKKYAQQIKTDAFCMKGIQNSVQQKNN